MLISYKLITRYKGKVIYSSKSKTYLGKKMSLFDIHISLSCRALCALSITVMLNEVDGGDADTDDDDDDDDD